MKKKWLVAFAPASAFVVGCTSSSTNAQSCISADAGDPRAFLPNSQDSTRYPECPVKCGAKLGSSADYSVADLPAGSCDGSLSHCNVQAGVRPTYPEGCTATNGMYCAINMYRCDCSNGNWQCFVAEQGGGACTFSNCPASSSGAADASSD
jgi:hypothetical protein